eukprot:TRINITY_DN18501_c0_g1_i1.p2 TRINITY_DN18501_c0_g1~~TRINITY_DN18501_c0_g1_i1.p2  ORF type:complete len:145 (+),score=3.95 TRINITY_DN18501_c0_g1_i1:85-519(+)
MGGNMGGRGVMTDILDKKDPPIPHARVKQAGIGALPDIPPEVELGPADAWQPPRLRTTQPLSKYKYQYRGGWGLFFDSARTPMLLLGGALILVKSRHIMNEYLFGPVDTEIFDMYHDWDRKRPGAWPPYKPGQETFGVKHEIST